MNNKCFDAARISLTGDRRINQDRCLVLAHHGAIIMALADGLGGHPRGEVAAQLFIDICESLFRQEQKPMQDPERFMLRCIHKANQAIVQFGDRQRPPISPRTTAVIAIMQNGTARWMHVGDSRLYMLRDAGIFTQTRDHSHIHVVQPADGTRAKIRSSITRCLGGLDEPPTITTAPATELQPDDCIMLCSDGLWGQVTPERLLVAFGETEDFTQSICSLANDAQRFAAPKSDNVTVVALRWQCEQEPDSEEIMLHDDADDSLDTAIEYLRGVVKKHHAT